MNNADETRTNGIGKLAEDYVYQSDDSSTSEDETGKIPAGSIGLYLEKHFYLQKFQKKVN